MNYSEAKQTYKRLFAKYPEVTSLWRPTTTENNITLTVEEYEKRGARWILTDSTTEKINYTFYYNTVDPNASDFFKNLGGYERTTCAYTRAGFIPVQCVSINPSRDRKTVRKFDF